MTVSLRLQNGRQQLSQCKAAIVVGAAFSAARSGPKMGEPHELVGEALSPIITGGKECRHIHNGIALGDLFSLVRAFPEDLAQFLEGEAVLFLDFGKNLACQLNRARSGKSSATPV